MDFEIKGPGFGRLRGKVERRQSRAPEGNIETYFVAVARGKQFSGRTPKEAFGRLLDWAASR